MQRGVQSCVTPAGITRRGHVVYRSTRKHTVRAGQRPCAVLRLSHKHRNARSQSDTHGSCGVLRQRHRQTHTNTTPHHSTIHMTGRPSECGESHDPAVPLSGGQLDRTAWRLCTVCTAGPRRPCTQCTRGRRRRPRMVIRRQVRLQLHWERGRHAQSPAASHRDKGGNDGRLFRTTRAEDVL